MEDIVEDEGATVQYKVTAAELRQFVERIERLEAEKKAIAEQAKEVLAEARGRGYDVKVLKKLIALRKREPQDVSEEEAILQLYREEGHYLHRTCHYVERVGLDYVKSRIVEDEEGRKALYGRLVDSLKDAKDPWAERVAGKQKNEFEVLEA